MKTEFSTYNCFGFSGGLPFDGKGNSVQLNKGYAKGGDKHGGPYLKITDGHTKIRIPLEGNPDL